MGGQLGSAILPDGNPLTLHYVMFIPTLLGQGSMDQQTEWINKAWNCQIVGTYAQVSTKFSNWLNLKIVFIKWYC